MARRRPDSVDNLRRRIPRLRLRPKWGVTPAMEWGAERIGFGRGRQIDFNIFASPDQSRPPTRRSRLRDCMRV